MVHYLLIALGLDLCVLAAGFPLQKRYLRHLRHRHRAAWESLLHQSPRTWHYYKGMPTTGLLLLPVQAERQYRSKETSGWLWVGRLVIALNLLHAMIVAAILVLAVALFLS